MPYKSTLLALAAASISSTSLACTESSAFGVKFGQPVSSRAHEVQEYYFTGGTELRSFLHPVPTPLDGFENYAQWSYKDKRSVYAVVAYRQLIKDQKLLFNDEYRTEVLEKTKLEIAKLIEAWGHAYDLKYRSESASGLTWVAEADHVKSKIGTLGGEFLYVECENKRLYSEAMAKALGR